MSVETCCGYAKTYSMIFNDIERQTGKTIVQFYS